MNRVAVKRMQSDGPFLGSPKRSACCQPESVTWPFRIIARAQGQSAESWAADMSVRPTLPCGSIGGRQSLSQGLSRCRPD